MKLTRTEVKKPYFEDGQNPQGAGHMTIKFYLIRHTLQSLKQAGFDWRPKRERIKQVITAKLQTVNHILTNGLDVGTLIEHRIPVNLVYHPDYG